MSDLKLAPVLEATQLAAVAPALAAWFDGDLAGVAIEGTRLQAPWRYWVTYRRDERRVTLRVSFEGEAYLRDCSRLERVFAGRRDQFDHVRGGFTLLPELNAVLWSFPFDPAMPSLARCFDGAWIGGLLAGPLEREPGAPLAVSVASYAPEVGAVFRYREPETGVTLAFGKCAPQDTSALIYAAMREFWNSSAGRTGQLRLARPLAYWPEAALLLQAPVSGQSLSSERNRRIFLDLVQHAGGALAAMHTSAVTFGPERTLEDLTDRLRRALPDVEHTLPPILADFRRLAQRLEARAVRAVPRRLVASHGDFKWDQFLEEHGRYSLIDFEYFCQAEPELDLGHFCAYLYPSQSADWRDGAVVGVLRSAFLEHYRQASGFAIDLQRLGSYEAAAFGLRVLSFIWQHQQGWQWQAAQLLETALDRLVDPAAAG